jgi:hypothetical protein
MFCLYSADPVKHDSMNKHTFANFPAVGTRHAVPLPGQKTVVAKGDKGKTQSFGSNL